MRLSDVITVLRTLADESLAEDWDKVGLHVGDEARMVRKAMVCIDLTEPVIDEAIAGGADLVVAYHPPIFAPLGAVTTASVKSRIVYKAVRKGIAIYSPHTALDSAPGGVNDWLAGGLGKGQVTAIRPAVEGARYKLVVFVPHDHAEALRQAMTTAGGGRIGDYSACSFAVNGEGTFRGGATTHPTVGKRGCLEHVPELRMEMVVDRAALGCVVQALRAAHPYEQPAFDVYRLEAIATSAGQGRVVTLDKAVTLNAAASRVSKLLKVRQLEVAKARGGKIKRIGLCAGAGGSLLGEAGDIDLFLTGEMRHHDVLAAVAGGVSVILAGHTQTERPYLPTYRKRIIAALPGVTWTISRRDRPPSSIISSRPVSR